MEVTFSTFATNLGLNVFDNVEAAFMAVILLHHALLSFAFAEIANHSFSLGKSIDRNNPEVIILVKPADNVD
jgi:hypothetical protein